MSPVLKGTPGYLDDAALGYVVDKLTELRDVGKQDLLVPSIEQLRELVSSVFWASLEREEGRPLRPVVTLVNPQDDHFGLRFHERQPLTAAGLARLSPAVPSHGTIGVAFGADGEAEMWGFAFQGENGLVIEGSSPGVLFLRRFNTLLVLRGQHVERIETDDVRRSTLLRQVRGIGTHWSDGAHRSRRSLYEIATEMVALGHGGALLIVPDRDGPWQSSVRMGYRQAEPPDNTLAWALESSFKASQKVIEATEALDLPEPEPLKPEDFQFWVRNGSATYLRQLEASRRYVARLSAVDGAVILDPDLYILAFGAKILAPASTLTHVRLVRPVVGVAPELLPLDRLGGTRHQSAARFVHDLPGSSAIVVSQDGAVSIIGREKDDGEVVVLRNAELTFRP